MDPITAAILAAVVTGAATGATQVATQAVIDGYNALKARLQAKFGANSKVVQAVENVEEEPDLKPNQDLLAARVEQIKAADDDELVKLANELLAALEKTVEGQQAVGKYNIQARNSEIGVIGDHAHVEGGINFGKKE